MNIVKVALIGAGGYLLYDYLTGGGLVSKLLGGAGSVVGTGQTGATTPSVNAMTQTSQITTYQLMASRMRNDAHIIAQGGLGTASQYNYYYQLIKGVPAKLTNNPYPSSYLMTLDQWWTLASASGLSGLGTGYSMGAHSYQRWVN